MVQARGVQLDILPRLKTWESHDTTPLVWDMKVYDTNLS
ncbi:MAG: hypothetical protein J07HQW2_02274 [Haloquadratum walsbyi J07HQW2]|uniref:Uncharacterized protein n=1 Tax=Haloquadratum walsbyi J07HQW2 TaxID=1238425 RepID=U1MZ69_9EURY|nr:MAG: hypothetical protein J07HQW2_02274 [Haloquadratum walsbyi J07HQW2]